MVYRVGAIHESPANSHKQTIGECRGGYYPPAKIRTKQTDNPEACPYGVIIKHLVKPQFEMFKIKIAKEAYYFFRDFLFISFYRKDLFSEAVLP